MFIEKLFFLEKGNLEIYGIYGIYSFIIKIGIKFNFFLNYSIKILIIRYFILLFFYIIFYLNSLLEFNIEDIKEIYL
jgi:hypothetical protein